MACIYTYNGIEYNREEILERIKNGMLTDEDTIARARLWLRDKLGMTDDQISEVAGLIDNKSLGRLLGDGNILLSSFMTTGTEYHEAFHRVFRFHATAQERAEVMKEIKNDPSVNLDEIKKLYPDKTLDEQYEEYLAEEFRYYVMHEGNYFTSPKVKSLLGRIWHALKNLISISNTASKRLDMYRNIVEGNYRATFKADSPYQGKIADQRLTLSNGEEFSIQEKNELISAVASTALRKIFQNNAIYQFLDGTLRNDKVISESFAEVVGAAVKQVAGNTELLNKMQVLVEDTFMKGGYIDVNSSFYVITDEYLKAMGLKITPIEDNINEIDETKTETDGKDKAFDKIAVQYDSKANMSQAIKLMLASVYEVDKDGQPVLSGIFKLPVQLPWNKVANLLTDRLSMVTPEMSIFMDKIIDKITDHPSLNQIITILGGRNFNPVNDAGYDTTKLRIEFVQNFAKNKYNFLLGMMNGKDIYTFDSNSAAVVDKVLGNWRNDFLTKYDNIPDIYQALRDANDAKSIVDALGLSSLESSFKEEIEGKTVEARLKGVRKTLIDVIEKANELEQEKAEGDRNMNNPMGIMDRLFSRHRHPDLKDLDVTSNLTQLASVAAQFEKPVNLQIFNAENKKVYNIALNTLQSIILNKMHEISAQPTPEARLDMLKKMLPQLVTPFTFRDENTPSSYWLKRLINDGIAPKLNIYDGGRVEGGESDSMSNLNETDLIAYTINSVLSGVNLGVKHSDRSTFFAYGFNEKNPRIVTRDAKITIDNGALELVPYLADELIRIQRLRNDGIGADIMRFRERGDALSVFKFLQEGDLSVDAGEINTLLKKSPEEMEKAIRSSSPIMKALRGFLKAESAEIREDMDKWKLSALDNSGKPYGVSYDHWIYYKEKLENITAAVAVNSVLGHIEEIKILIGDLAYYKNADDSYKRFSMQSSNGEISVVDEKTNAWVEDRNTRDGMKLYDVRSGKIIETQYGGEKGKPTDGSATEIVLEENDNYRSGAIKMLTETFKTGLMEDVYPDLMKMQGMTEEKALSIINDRVDAYVDGYQRKFDESDGQSYINIFGWREMMHRGGKWSTQLENVFQMELAILKLADKKHLKNATAWFLKDTNGVIQKVSATQVNENYYEAKIFEENEHDGYSAYMLVNGLAQAAAPMKPQYTGPMMDRKLSAYQQLDMVDRDNVIAGRKTSYFVMMPSSIIGTNMQKLNVFMLKNGVDMVHMGSAAKYGHVTGKGNANIKNEYTKANGAQMYDANGDLNDVALEEDIDTLKTYLDYRYMKHQQNISNDPKKKIKNSTQAMKIMLSNLSKDGVYRDVDENGYSELEELANEYKDILNQLIDQSREKLLKDLDVDADGAPNVKKLREFLLAAAKDRGEAINILDSIEMFADTIEMLPNKTRIENILFGLVSNRVLDFKRPGTMVPQISNSMFETGNRTIDADGKIISNNLDYYRTDPETNNLLAAEAIMPLPKNLIRKVMKASGKTNLAEALDWLNARLDRRSKNYSPTLANSFTWKTLRIPNQQLGSSGVYTIREFLMPTNDAFIIVPSENVVKTGGDFDIDKLSIYFKELNDELLPIDSLTNKFIEVENKLLLHKANKHIFLAPLVDSILSDVAVRKILGEYVNKHTEAQTIENEALSYTDQTTDPQVVSVRKNILKTLHYVGGKVGIGPVAVSITGHSLSMMDQVELSETYTPTDSSDSQLGENVTTTLPFDGMDSLSITMMNDVEGNNILEVLSALITSQVDVGKNPYPVELGINIQTLNVITYLVRRGVPIIRILTLVKQPVVQRYLELQRINESQLYKANGIEEGKADVIGAVISEKGLGSYGDYKSMRLAVEKGLLRWTDAQLAEGIGGTNSNQLGLLATFLHLQDQAKVFRMFSRDASPDTQRIKDLATHESLAANAKKLNESGFIKSRMSYINGMLKPFHTVRATYRGLFRRYFFTRRFKGAKSLADFKDMMLQIPSNEDRRIRLANKIDNDFILFTVSQKHPDMLSRSFDTLMKGKASVAKKLRRIQKGPDNDSNPLKNNYAIEELYSVLNNRKDQLDGKTIDNIRLFHKAINSFEANDLIEAMEDVKRLDPEFFKDLVLMNFMQVGMNNGIFNIDKILPAEYRSSVLQESINKSSGLDIDKFAEMFMRNHPEELPTTRDAATKKDIMIPYYTRYDRNTGYRNLYHIQTENGTNDMLTPALGDGYTHVRYATAALVASNNAAEIIQAEAKENALKAQEAGKKATAAMNNVGKATKKKPTPAPKAVKTGNHQMTVTDEKIEFTLDTPDGKMLLVFEEHGGLDLFDTTIKMGKAVQFAQSGVISPNKVATVARQYLSIDTLQKIVTWQSAEGNPGVQKSILNDIKNMGGARLYNNHESEDSKSVKAEQIEGIKANHSHNNPKATVDAKSKGDLPGTKFKC